MQQLAAACEEVENRGLEIINLRHQLHDKTVASLIGPAEAVDKTAPASVDYASLAAGGRIVDSSPTYRRTTTIRQLLGFIRMFWTDVLPKYEADVIIMHQLRSSHCWSFARCKGYVTIRFLQKISVKEVVLKHMSKTSSPTGEISEAPKDFSVVGLTGEDDEKGVHLGSFTFNDEGESLQIFSIKSTPTKVLLVKIVYEIRTTPAYIACTCMAYRKNPAAVLLTPVALTNRWTTSSSTLHLSSLNPTDTMNFRSLLAVVGAFCCRPMCD